MGKLVLLFRSGQSDMGIGASQTGSALCLKPRGPRHRLQVEEYAMDAVSSTPLATTRRAGSFRSTTGHERVRYTAAVMR